MLVLNIRGQARSGGRVPNVATSVIRNAANIIISRTTHRWLAYTQGSQPLEIVQQAIQLIRARVLNNQEALDSCNDRFQRVGQVSFADTVDGPRIVVISRNWEHQRGYFGATQGNHISIAQFCFSRTPNDEAVLNTAATLIHELAHVVGAPGNAHYTAEAAVRDCGFVERFMPGPIGALSIPQIMRQLA